MTTLRRLGVLAGLLALAGCDRPATAPPAPNAAPMIPAASTPTPTAVRVTRLDLGNAIGADGRVVRPGVQFAPRDTLYASVGFHGRDALAHAVVVRWTYLDTRQVVREEGKTLLLPGNTTTLFQLAKPSGWPPGAYRLELLVDGTLAQARVFEVR